MIRTALTSIMVVIEMFHFGAERIGVPLKFIDIGQSVNGASA
jgi:hypothetical protein